MPIKPNHGNEGTPTNFPSSSIMGSTPRPKPDSQFGIKSHPSLFPNLPQPVNGMIKTYDSNHRTFSRPYSAKTVFFYKEGDHYFTGLRVPISKSKYRNIDSLLDDLTGSIQLPFGVRRLHTPIGRTPVESLNQLQHLGKYVASSSKVCRGVNFEAIEKHRQRIEEANQRWRQLEVQNRFWNELNSNRYHAKFRNNHGINFLPITAKQMFFVLNGHPSRLYRYLLNPTKRVDFDILLEEVSRGLETAIFKIYNYSGERITSVEQLFDLKEARVLAVPRHERPILNGMSLSSLTSGSTNRSTILPPIYKKISVRTGFSNTPPSNDDKSPGRGKYHETNNSIERPRRVVPQKVYPVISKRTVMPVIPPAKRQPPPLRIIKKNEAPKNKPPPKRKRIKTPAIKLSVIPIGGTGSTADESDSGRPRSEEKSLSATHDEESEEDDYPNGPSEEEEEDEDESKSSRNTGLRESDEDEEKKEKDVDGSFNNKTNDNMDARENDEESNPPTTNHNSHLDKEYTDREVEAAVTIQKYTRGYLTRKHLNEQKENNEGDGENDDFFETDENFNRETNEEESESMHENKNEDEEEDEEENSLQPAIDDEERKRREEAAIVIQKHYRGFQVRKQYAEQHKDPKKLAEVRKNYEQFDDDELRKRNDAAVVIQKHYRGYRVRKQYANEYKDPKKLAEVRKNYDQFDDDELRKRNDAAVVIQKHYRGFRVRKQLDEEKQSRRQSPILDVEEEGEEEEKEEEQEHEAATVIQKHYRGYRVRKHLKEEQKNSPPMMPEKSLEDEDEHNRRNDAAITIQKHYRGYRVRRDLADQKITEMEQLNDPYVEEPTIDSSREQEHDSGRLNTAFLDPSHSEENIPLKVGNDENFTYTVSVFTGNRWAADTEADLYLSLHGDLADSDKYHLTQDVTDPKFRQNRMDSFIISTPKTLGKLQKIVVGHDHSGYGAGLFIDRITVTENISDGRQYLFTCQKWLDSSQVDGKIERSLKCSSIYYLSSMPEDSVKTKGRWELIFHNGDDKGKGGTTSSLTIVGYGTNGQGVTSQLYDSNFATVPSTSLIQALPIQVDFGEIGELIKVRIEIDGTGKHPDYFLDYVELRDLDTEERIDCMCGKWLKWESTDKGAQSFRELIVFRSDVEPIPIVTYEGKIRVLQSKVSSASPLVKVELYGELGETGLISVVLDGPTKKKGILDIPFKIECVSLGRVSGARIYFQPTSIGAELYEGFSLIQRYLGDDAPVSVGDEWLVSYMLLRESAHTPYRYVMNQARVRPRTDVDDPYVKELLVTEMEGLSTKISKKKAPNHEKSHWILSMSLGDSNLLPKVTLCGEEFSAEMEILNSTPTDWILSYSLKDIDLGLLRKVRIEVDQNQRLNVFPEEGDNPENHVFIKKMRLCDTVNGDELRFPSANVDLVQYSVYEFPAIWPDYPPIQNVLYDVTVNTGDCKSDEDFKVHLNLFGEKGDVGYRLLSKDLLRPCHFESDSQQSFEIEAVSIGEITTAEITVEAYSDFKWQCKEIVVTDVETSMFYIFNFSKTFTPETRRQNCSVSLLTDSL